jgi:hypothetical protein
VDLIGVISNYHMDVINGRLFGHSGAAQVFGSEFKTFEI